MSIFAHTHFLIVESGAVPSESFPDSENALSATEIRRIIEQNGGSLLTVSREASKSMLDQHKISHIISETTDFAEYELAMTRMVPVTTSKWIADSVASSLKRNYRLYMAKPVPFMDHVVLCVADNLPQEDKEAMYAGVRAFGGQFLDALLSYTTHLVAVDMSTVKLVVAANIRQQPQGPHIQIVLPHWIDACMRLQRHVDEKPYLLLNPVVEKTGKPDFSVELELELDPVEQAAAGGTVLSGKRVFLAADYHLSEHLRQAIYALIEGVGGSIVPVYDVLEIDIYIGKHRLGTEYRQSVQRLSSGMVVASLPWLYHIVTTGKFVSPLASNLLHFPVPATEVAQFHGLRISITGITGDARHYLSSLLTSMGATFTKTLDCNNHILVCAQKLGAKYIAAALRWPDIRVVNPIWVEECFAQWRYLDPTDPRYTVRDNLCVLGQTHISTLDIIALVLDLGDQDPPLDVGDSVYECESPPPPPPPQSLSLSLKTMVSSGNQESHTETLETSQITQQNPVTILSSPALGRAGRSAKAKASLKLSSDMEDLNQYTSMAKSSRKMKSYMEQLEQATPTKKKKSSPEIDVEAETNSQLEPQPQPKRAKVEKKNKVHLVAIMTGCELILTPTKADLTKLLKLGIQVVTDYSPKKHIDTIVAPKVLRTEKFLKSLSKATRIVHPSYLVDILGRHSVASLSWEELAKEFNIDHYALDKVVPIKQINEDLGVSGKESGLAQLLSPDVRPVFENMALNLSLNLNGGADLIASILQEHGLTALKVIKLTAGVRKSGLLSMDDDTSVLIAHKTKDKKFASKLEGVTVVDWEWCVKSIFHKKVQNYENYLI